MKRFPIKRIAVDSLFLAILIICAFITIPFGSIPVTLQVFGIILILFLLPNVDSLIIITLYALMGTIGIPVFSGGTSGFSFPSYGFILGFVLSSIVILVYSKLTFKWNKKDIVDIIIKASLFIIVIYLVGVPYCMMMTKMSFASAIIYFLPFIGIDIIKIIIAAFIYKRMKNIIKY